MTKKIFLRTFQLPNCAQKLLQIMKLATLILMLTALHVSARVYTQDATIKIDFQSGTLADLIQAIETQSDFRIFYKTDQVDVHKNVVLPESEGTIAALLTKALEESDVSYQLLDRLIVLTTSKTNGQQMKITGTVTDASTGEPLPGVNIMIEGTQLGVVSDIKGQYVIQVPESSFALIFSYIGYNTTRIEVAGKSVIDVALVLDVKALEEVVVVGYGVQRKVDVTGATSRLTSDNMNMSLATSPVEMMQGRISGVNVLNNDGEPGAGMSVRIRGSSSIRSGQEPLYVIDGIPLDNADLTPNGSTVSGLSGSSNKNPISFLNPDDIESIDILKDASSTAIYGSRGANGVIMITTKKGKQGEGTLTYDGYAGFSKLYKKIDVLSAEDFRAYRRPNDGTPLPDEGASIDWQDEVYRTAVTQSHTLTYGGGTEKHTYRASLGYINQEGILKTTGIEKINGKIQVSQKAFKNRLYLTGNIIVSHMKDKRAPIGETGGYEGDVILNALKLNPTYPIFNPDGSYYQNSTTQRNPVAMLYLTNDITLTDHTIANMSGELEIVKGLKYKLNVGFDRTLAERRINQDNDLTYLSNHGEADINAIEANNRLIENYITYEKKIRENHQFNFLLGHAYQYFKVLGNNLHVNGFTVEDILYTNNLNYGNFSNANSSSYATENELQSFFGRINYNFKDKYLVTFTGRVDGSTKFGENNKYGFFPSGALAWRLSEEDFIKSLGVFSNLKLRIGYGKTGNQEIPNKISQLSVGTTGSANGYFNGTLAPGITFIRTPNPDIQWETTTQMDVGIDFGILNDRLSGTVDIFHKTTEDVLLYLPVPLAPTDNGWKNVDDLKIINNGIELGLNGIIVKNENIVWDAGLNFSYIRNNVVDLPVTLIETGNASGQGISNTRVQVITNDEPIGTFYGRVFQGFDANGMSVYKTDNEGNEVLEPLGSALPDYTYSFNSKVTFRNFDLSMFWYGVNGNKVYNNTRNALFVKGSLNSGSNVTYDVSNSEESISNSNAFSSRFVEDGSFLRLSNVTLGYTLNTASMKWIQSARLYVTGNNLLLITDYSGYDPEVNTDANQDGIPSIGIDYTTYPKSRAFTIGISLKF